MEQTTVQNSVVTLYDDGSISIERQHETINVEPHELQATDVLRERREVNGIQG